MGASVGLALDVVVVVCGDGGVGFLVKVGVRLVVVVVSSALDKVVVVQFSDGENFTAKVVVSSVLVEIEVVQFAGGENFSAKVVVCSVLDGVAANLDHCCSFLAFNFSNCWVKWVRSFSHHKSIAPKKSSSYVASSR